MRLVLAILGGLSLSVITFIVGLTIAAGYYSASYEKQNLTSNEILWTTQPVRVDAATTALQRVQSTRQEAPISKDGEQSSAQVDATTTGSIQAESVPVFEDTQLNEAHLDWCSSRYRSYRPRDNSYTPYSGGRRECVSPFSQQADNPAALSPPPNSQDSFPEEDSHQIVAIAAQSTADYGGGAVSPEHAASCHAQYRSYRAEDNTYQPYGGGRRLQCE